MCDEVRRYSEKPDHVTSTVCSADDSGKSLEELYLEGSRRDCKISFTYISGIFLSVKFLVSYLLLLLVFIREDQLLNGSFNCFSQAAAKLREKCRLRLLR